MPGGDSRVAGAVCVAEEGRSGSAAQTVRRDDDVAVGRVGQGAQVGHVLPVAHHAVVERGGEGLEQGRPRDHVHGVAGAAAQAREVHVPDEAAVGPEEVAPDRRAGPLPGGTPDPQFVERPQRSLPQTDRGSGAGWVGSAFADLDVPAAGSKVNGGGETAYAAADDDRFPGHATTVLCL